MKRTAFTLIEIIASVAIVLALLAIVVPVYRQALTQGKTTVDVSNLRQLAAAAAMYHDQNNEQWPSNSKALVHLGVITKEICRSPRDVYEEGWSNRYLKGVARHLPVDPKLLAPWQSTYLCFADVHTYRRDEMNRLLVEQPNSGLFVNMIDTRSEWPNDDPTGPFKGGYQRALLDGSVITRTVRWFEGTNADGKPERRGSDMSWFFDPSEQWISDLFR